MNAVEELLGTRTGGPTADTPVTKDEFARLEMSRTIVLENFGDIAEFVDGDLGRDGLIVVHRSQKVRAVARTLFQYLHNHLASLYSFNEQVRVLVNEKASGHAIEKADFSPRKGVSPPCEYAERLAFLRGLRHSMQHGDYRSLDFRILDTRNGFEFREVTFDQHEFTSGTVNYPMSFIQYANPSAMAKPIPYLADFHQHYFLDFARDCFDWLNGNP